MSAIAIVVDRVEGNDVHYTLTLFRSNGQSEQKGICKMGEAIQISKAELEGNER